MYSGRPVALHSGIHQQKQQITCLRRVRHSHMHSKAQCKCWFHVQHFFSEITRFTIFIDSKSYLQHLVLNRVEQQQHDKSAAETPTWQHCDERAGLEAQCETYVGSDAEILCGHFEEFIETRYVKGKKIELLHNLSKDLKFGGKTNSKMTH